MSGPIPLDSSDRDGRHSLGMALALASFTMMFGGLMVAYLILRNDAPVWPPPGAPRIPRALPLVATLALAGSSYALDRAVRAVRAARRRALLRHLGTTLVLGLVFLALQAVVWWQLFTVGLDTRSTYAGTFYMITWFHAAHILVALSLLGFLLVRTVQGRIHGRRYGPLRFTAWFWHFLGCAWLVIFVGVYLS